LLVAVLYVVDRLMSQTADGNIPSSVGMFQWRILLSCGFFLLYMQSTLCLKNASDLRRLKR